VCVCVWLYVCICAFLFLQIHYVSSGVAPIVKQATPQGSLYL